MADEVIGGYRLTNLILSGQTSQVWEVVEEKSHRHFAMKLLLPEKTSESQHRKFILHEAAVGKALAHPNIIRIVSVGKNPKNPYFVMEFFPAGSLKLRMIRKEYDFVKEHAPSIIKEGATALAYMNASGWVHRDVKPDNYLVNSLGELRLIDFALAQRVEKPNFFSKLFRRKPNVAGTRSYMSPEQIRGQPLDGRADIYSFGCTAYEIVAKRVPFVGSTSQELLTKHIIEKPQSPQAFNEDVTDDFSDLVLHMLRKKKEDRPKDFHQVLMDLRKMKIFKSEKPKPKGE